MQINIKRRISKNDIYSNSFRLCCRSIGRVCSSSCFIYVFYIFINSYSCCIRHGGIASVAKGNFDLRIFLSGFFGNAILSIALTYLGERLNVDIYLAAIVVFVGRMFINLAIIRRYYIEKWVNFIERKKENKKVEANTSK